MGHWGGLLRIAYHILAHVIDGIRTAVVWEPSVLKALYYFTGATQNARISRLQPHQNVLQTFIARTKSNGHWTAKETQGMDNHDYVSGFTIRSSTFLWASAATLLVTE